MEIKEMMYIPVLWLITALLGCSQKHTNERELCEEFYQLNKDKEFKTLFNVAIGCGRVKNVYDNTTGQYDLKFIHICIFDSTSGDFVLVPVFNKGATNEEKDSIFANSKLETKEFFSRISGKSNEMILSGLYAKYIEDVYKEYDMIETPKQLGFKDIPVEGHPRSGRFLTFKLNQHCTVYYVLDSSSLIPFWKEHFRRIEKLDNSWYFEITFSDQIE